MPVKAYKASGVVIFERLTSRMKKKVGKRGDFSFFGSVAFCPMPSGGWRAYRKIELERCDTPLYRTFVLVSRGIANKEWLKVGGKLDRDTVICCGGRTYSAQRVTA
jgi:hypothetical protein